MFHVGTASTHGAPNETNKRALFFFGYTKRKKKKTHILHLGRPNGELLLRDPTDLDLNASHGLQALAEEVRHDGIHQDLRAALSLDEDIADLPPAQASGREKGTVLDGLSRPRII